MPGIKQVNITDRNNRLSRIKIIENYRTNLCLKLNSSGKNLSYVVKVLKINNK